MNFAAIDFETATGSRNSACAVAIITVTDGQVSDEFYRLIQPPENYYWGQSIAMHGIRPADTVSAPTFAEIYPEVRERLQGQVVVAHNEQFDRSVLRRTMEHHGLDYRELTLADRWKCTCRLYRAKGFQPASLDACCARLNIPLDHHNALSDAQACAQLFLFYQTGAI